MSKQIFPLEYKLLEENKGAYEVVLKETIEEILSGNKQANSLQTLVIQERLPCYCSRMTSKPLVLKNGIYTGEMIKQIFVDSVNQFQYSFYPVSGQRSKILPKQLRLFVKYEDGYRCEAKFDITGVIETSVLDASQRAVITDTSVIDQYTTFNSLLRIENVQVKNLPQDYLGLKSAESIHDKAFRGQVSNVLAI